MPVCFEHLVNHLVTHGVIGDIEGIDRNILVTLKFACERIALDIECRDLGALLEKTTDNAMTNAVCRARHHSHLALKPLTHYSSLPFTIRRKIWSSVMTSNYPPKSKSGTCLLA